MANTSLAFMGSILKRIFSVIFSLLLLIVAGVIKTIGEVFIHIGTLINQTISK